MSKFLSWTLVLCLSVALQIAVFIFGWGLSPANWWWIIGGGVVGFTILRTIADALDREGKKATRA